MPSKTCTGATRVYSKTSGTPSSVKLQMNTIAAPANTPGMASGRVIRHSRRHGGQPRFWAACSIAGSRLDNAAAMFMYRIG